MIGMLVNYEMMIQRICKHACCSLQHWSVCCREPLNDCFSKGLRNTFPSSLSLYSNWCKDFFQPLCLLQTTPRARNSSQMTCTRFGCFGGHACSYWQMRHRIWPVSTDSLLKTDLSRRFLMHQGGACCVCRGPRHTRRQKCSLPNAWGKEWRMTDLLVCSCDGAWKLWGVFDWFTPNDKISLFSCQAARRQGTSRTPQARFVRFLLESSPSDSIPLLVPQTNQSPASPPPGQPVIVSLQRECQRFLRKLSGWKSLWVFSFEILWLLLFFMRISWGLNKI